MQEYIYKIVCLANNKIYVGRTCNAHRRRREHFKKLSQGIHCNKYLQNTYNKCGKDNFLFEVIETTTNNLVGERELFWFKTLSEQGVTLFNHIITSSGGGTDSKTPITRSYIFDVIDDMYKRGLGIKEGARQHKTSTATILKYIPEWEVRTCNKFCRQPQVAETLERMQVFVDAWLVEGDSAYRRLSDFKLSHSSLVRHLPMFGLSFEDVRLDVKFKTTKERALQAIKDVREGLHYKDSLVKNDIGHTSYYKYLKEQEQQCHT